MKRKYTVYVYCGWIEVVSAESETEAVEKMERKYKDGKGRFPRENVTAEIDREYWCEIE